MSALDWDSFAAGLADELTRLEAGATVVILERGKGDLARFAQFAQEDAVLLAEVCENDLLDEAVHATPEGEGAIAAAGWNRPDDSRDLWWHDLPWPAATGDYRALADMVVTALRDGYRIPAPAGLAYKAWNDRKDNEPIDLPALGIPREN